MRGTAPLFVLCQDATMNSVFSSWHLIFLLIYPAVIALGCWLAYSLIRAAVRKALRQHQEWLDTREAPRPPSS